MNNVSVIKELVFSEVKKENWIKYLSSEEQSEFKSLRSELTKLNSSWNIEGHQEREIRRREFKTRYLFLLDKAELAARKLFKLPLSADEKNKLFISFLENE